MYVVRTRDVVGLLVSIASVVVFAELWSSLNWITFRASTVDRAIVTFLHNFGVQSGG